MEEELLRSEYDVTGAASYHTNQDYYDHQPSRGVLSFDEGNKLGYHGDHNNYGYSGYAKEGDFLS